MTDCGWSSRAATEETADKDWEEEEGVGASEVVTVSGLRDVEDAQSGTVVAGRGGSTLSGVETEGAEGEILTLSGALLLFNITCSGLGNLRRVCCWGRLPGQDSGR